MRTVDIWVVLTGPGTNRIVRQFSRTLAPGGSFQRSLPRGFPAAREPEHIPLLGMPAHSLPPR